MYDYHEKERAPDLESILADFMTYQASSKGYCYFMQQQGTQFERNLSSAGYQWESCRQSDYHNKAGGVLNLDDLLMQFKDIVESIQQAFRRTETHISKLVDDMTNSMARKEEERAEIEIHQESIRQVTSIHHQLTNEEEKPEVSSTPKYPYLATVGYVGGKDKGRLELSMEDQKIAFDLFEAMKHSDIGDALSESETENMVFGSANIDSLEELLGKLVEKLNMERKLSAQTREAELENQKLQTEISSLKDKLEQKAAIEEQIFTIDGKIRKLQDLVGDALSESETENLVSCSANIDSLEELLRKLIENHAKLSSMKPAYGVVGDGLHSQ